MATQLRWKASLSASACHAAGALCAGIPLVDPDLAESLAAPTDDLQQFCAAHGFPPARLFQHLVPLAAEIAGNRDLGRRVLIKCLGPTPALETWVEHLAGPLTRLEAAFQQQVPETEEQLALRGAPWRELWEARGPGLLHQVGKLSDSGLLADEATVILVYPATGGGGVAQGLYNSVRVEALLANPWERLPETLRLGWLLAQLQLDLPVFHGPLSRDRAMQVGAWALLPIVLAAGEEVELCRLDQVTLQLAAQQWLKHSAEEAQLLAQTLGEWWDIYSQQRPSWPVALGALDRLLVEPA